MSVQITLFIMIVGAFWGFLIGLTLLKIFRQRTVRLAISCIVAVALSILESIGFYHLCIASEFPGIVALLSTASVFLVSGGIAFWCLYFDSNKRLKNQVG